MSSQPDVTEKFSKALKEIGKALKEAHISILKTTLIAFTKYELTPDKNKKFRDYLAAYEKKMNKLIEDTVNEYKQNKNIESAIDKLLNGSKRLLDTYDKGIQVLGAEINAEMEEKERLERSKIVDELVLLLLQHGIRMNVKDFEQAPIEVLKAFLNRLKEELPSGSTQRKGRPPTTSMPPSTQKQIQPPPRIPQPRGRARDTITFPLMPDSLPYERAAMVSYILGLEGDELKEYLYQLGSLNYKIIAENIHRLGVRDPATRSVVDVPISKIPSKIQGELYNIYIQGNRFVIRFYAIGMPPELSDLFLEIGDAEITLYKE